MSRIELLASLCVAVFAAGCSAQPSPTPTPSLRPQPAETSRTPAEQAAEYQKASELGHPRLWVLKHGPKHVADWKAKAEKGDADAALLYGVALDCGAGVVPNRREGSVWLKKAAESKQPFAMLQLAIALYDHPSARPGIGWDREAGGKWLEKSVSAGCRSAKAYWVGLFASGNGGTYRNALDVEGGVWADALEDQYTVEFLKLIPNSLTAEATKPVVVKQVVRGLIATQLKQGNLDMMMWVAVFHEQGILGFDKSEAEGRKWLEKAAESNSTNAMLNLGDAHLTGRFGCPVDPAEAMKWFDKAVANGGCDARVAVAKIYLGQPKGVESPVEKALVLLEAAAAEGDPESIRTLGREHGPDGRLSKDNRKGVGYYRRLADHGDTPGMVAIARRIVLEPPTDPVERKKREDESTRWLEKAAARDNATAMMELFTRHTTGKYAEQDEKKGLIYLRDAARLKDGKALYRLAEVCAKGEFGSQKDVKEAEKFLREGIAAGSADCMFELGLTMFRTATSLDFTEENTGYWMMRQAAELGHAEAQYQVGLSHLKPGGSREARVNSDVADLMSRPTGEFRIKELFGEPSGSIRGKRGEDLKAARAWLELAANQGHARAKAALAELK